MYFTKLELINIQKHKNLTINLTKGLNIFTGDSGHGKTGMLRGMAWTFGEPVKSVVRDGELKCSYAITRDDGIVIKRIKHITRDKITGKVKTTTTNKYEVRYPNQDEPVIYNKVGKTIPPEIAELLGKIELEVDGDKLLLDFTKQKEPYFFLGEKASFRMKMLNKLTGTEVIDRTIHSYNKDISGINRNKGVIEKDLLKTKDERKEIDASLKAKKDILAEVKPIIDKLTKLKKLSESLESLIKNINAIDSSLNVAERDIKSKVILPQTDVDTIKILYEKCNTLHNLILNNSTIKQNLQTATHKLDISPVIDNKIIITLKSLNNKIVSVTKLNSDHCVICNNLNLAQTALKAKEIGNVNIGELKELCNRLSTLKLATLELSSNEKGILTLEKQIKCLIKQIEQNQVKIDSIVKEAGKQNVCPNCGWKL